MSNESANYLVDMQKHRDKWRGYAYGLNDKPMDFLDGNMVDPRPQTFLETNAILNAKLNAENLALAAQVERLKDVLGEMADFARGILVNSGDDDLAQWAALLIARAEKALALPASTCLQEHDAEVAARALRDAADAIERRQESMSGRWTDEFAMGYRYVAHDLRSRAALLSQDAQEVR